MYVTIIIIIGKGCECEWGAWKAFKGKQLKERKGRKVM